MAQFEQTQILQSIIFNSVDAIVLSDQEGKIIIWNDAAQKIFGFSKEEAIDNSLTIIIPERLREAHNSGIKRVVFSGETKIIGKTIEMIGLRKDGVEIPIELSLSCFKKDNRCFFTGIIRDITEKKKYKEEREKILRELIKTNNDLMQFNSIISHNLKGPVASLIGICELLKIDLSLSEKEELLSYVFKSAESINIMINDLNVILDVRLSLNEKTEKCNFGEIIENVNSILKQQIRQTGVEIITEIDSNVREINCIKSYLHSILYNLISNAIKYKSLQRTPIVKISILKNANKIIINVSDNGEGIDLDKHTNNLFGFYKRFNTSIDGKGLGLYMTKNQIETMGGTIEVTSGVGIGTSFIVSLPIRNETWKK